MGKTTATEALEVAAGQLTVRGQSIQRLLQQQSQRFFPELLSIAQEAASIGADVAALLGPLARAELRSALERVTVSAVTRKALTPSFEDADTVAHCWPALCESGRVVVYDAAEDIAAIATAADAIDYALAGDETPARCRCPLRSLPCAAPCAELPMAAPLAALLATFAAKGPAALVAATDAQGLVWGVVDQTCIGAAIASAVGGTALIRRAFSASAAATLQRFVSASEPVAMGAAAAEKIAKIGGRALVVVDAETTTVTECLLAMRDLQVPCIAVGRDAAVQFGFAELCRVPYTSTVSSLLPAAESGASPARATPETAMCDVAEQIVLGKRSCVWIIDGDSKEVVSALYPFDLLLEFFDF